MKEETRDGQAGVTPQQVQAKLATARTWSWRGGAARAAAQTFRRQRACGRRGSPHATRAPSDRTSGIARPDPRSASGSACGRGRSSPSDGAARPARASRHSPGARLPPRARAILSESASANSNGSASRSGPWTSGRGGHARRVLGRRACCGASPWRRGAGRVRTCCPTLSRSRAGSGRGATPAGSTSRPATHAGHIRTRNHGHGSDAV